MKKKSKSFNKVDVYDLLDGNVQFRIDFVTSWEVQDGNDEVLSSRVLMKRISDLKRAAFEMGLETAEIDKAQAIAVEIGLYLQKLLKALSQFDGAGKEDAEYLGVKEVARKVNMGQSTTYNYLKIALANGLIVSHKLNGLEFDNNAVEVIKKIKLMVINGDRVSRAVEKLKRAKGGEQNV